MKIITSEVNPDFSVTVFSVKEYKGGNGFYFHLTDNDSALTQLEIIAMGHKDVIDELLPLAKEAWGA